MPYSLLSHPALLLLCLLFFGSNTGCVETDNKLFDKVIIVTDNNEPKSDLQKTQALSLNKDLSGSWVAKLYTSTRPTAWLQEALTGFEVEITEDIKTTLKEMSNSFVASLIWQELFPAKEEITASWNLRLRQEPGTGFTWLAECGLVSAPSARLIVPKANAITVNLQQLLPDLGTPQLLETQAIFPEKTQEPKKVQGRIIANAEVRFDPLIREQTEVIPLKVLAENIIASGLLSLTENPLSEQDKQDILNFFNNIEQALPGFELGLRKGVIYQTDLNWQKVDNSLRTQLGTGVIEKLTPISAGNSESNTNPQNAAPAADQSELKAACFYSQQSYEKIYSYEENNESSELLSSSASTQTETSKQINEYQRFFYTVADTEQKHSWSYNFTPATEDTATQGAYVNQFQQTNYESATITTGLTAVNRFELLSTQHQIDFTLIKPQTGGLLKKGQIQLILADDP